MTLITSLAQDQPTRASIYTFHSAAPTMTNSRVEALGTGSQPPYLTIATSFSHAEAKDDNIINQLSKAGYQIHLIGDSLWGTIYSKELYGDIDSNSAYSQESLDAYVNSKLPTKLKETDWDFLITHVNELDHLAHKHTYNSIQARNQLKLNDQLINNCINIMNEDSLFLAFGDHGSTIAEGSHGGGTKEEIEAAFFAYSKKRFTFKHFEHPEELPLKTRELIEKLKKRKEKLFGFLIRDAFFQYDIVPTTAAMFNIPIPFKNLGLLIPELLHYDVQESRFISESLLELMMDHLVNFLQAYHYDGIAYNEHNEMKKQWLVMSRTYKEHKDDIPKMLQRLKNAMQIEEKYFNSPQTEMIGWEEYAQTIEQTVDLIVAMRDALTIHRREFTEQWCATNMVYLYGSWILRILLSISLALFILVTRSIIVNKKYELMSQYNYYKYALLAQTILIFIILFQYKLDNLTIPLCFLICLYSLYAQAMIIYNQSPQPLQSIQTFFESSIISPSKFPVIATILIYIYCTFGMKKIEIYSNFYLYS